MQDAGDFDTPEGPVPRMTARRAATSAALVAALTAALAAAGCAGRDGPVAPSAMACPGAHVPLCTDPARAVLIRAAVLDAADRIAPALENDRVRTQLVQAMTTLSTQLEVGDVARARETLGAVEVVLDSAQADARGERSTFPNDAADLDAIAAAIHEAATALADS